jgi:hypothetical protein
VWRSAEREEACTAFEAERASIEARHDAMAAEWDGLRAERDALKFEYARFRERAEQRFITDAAAQEARRFLESEGAVLTNAVNELALVRDFSGGKVSALQRVGYRLNDLRGRLAASSPAHFTRSASRPTSSNQARRGGNARSRPASILHNMSMEAGWVTSDIEHQQQLLHIQKGGPPMGLQRQRASSAGGLHRTPPHRGAPGSAHPTYLSGAPRL